MPAKKDNPRDSHLSVRVTAQDKEAIIRTAEAEGSTKSDVAYRLMLKGNLRKLVDSFFGHGFQQVENDGSETCTGGS